MRTGAGVPTIGLLAVVLLAGGRLPAESATKLWKASGPGVSVRRKTGVKEPLFSERPYKSKLPSTWFDHTNHGAPVLSRPSFTRYASLGPSLIRWTSLQVDPS